MRFNTKVFGVGSVVVTLSIGAAIGQDTGAAVGAATEVTADAGTKVMATVDGKEITRDDLINRIKQRMGPQGANLPAEQIEGFLLQGGKEVTDDLINEMLLDQASKAAKIEVESDSVEQAIERLKGAVPEGEEFGSFLKTMGTSEVELRKDFERSMRISKFLDTKTEGGVEPSEDEVKAFYEKPENAQYFAEEESVKARHILVKTETGLDGAAMEAKKAKIGAIRARLIGDKAEDFATVAKETSEGPSGPQGGDLGKFGRGQMVKEFEAAAFSQKVGEVGEPVKTQFGYHLILVEERSEAGGRVPLADVSGKISEFLKAQQGQEVIGKYVDGLREKAKIEYID